MLARNLMMFAASASGFSEARAWADAVIANGGTVSASRVDIIAAFISAEKSSGLWQITDDYWIFWAENAIQARTSIKQRRLVGVFNSPTFVADRHYAFDGLTSYLDTGFDPSLHSVAMATASINYEVYERTNVNSSSSSFGVSTSSSRVINAYPRNGGAVTMAVGGLTASFTLATATSMGLTQLGRNGSTVSSIYGAKNGVDLVKAADFAALSPSLPNATMFIGGCNVLGSYAQGRASSVGYCAIGASLDATQRLARYNNVQSCATAVGAQV